MSYTLSYRSIEELKGVHPELVKVVKYAIGLSTQDFRVLDGVRTKQEQLNNVVRGVSQTKNSYHLYGLAVDLVPIVNGKFIFDIKMPNGKVDHKATKALYAPIAKAMKQAAKELGVELESGFDDWGWDYPHYQKSKLKGVDARKVYDVRRGGYFA